MRDPDRASANNRYQDARAAWFAVGPGFWFRARFRAIELKV